MRPPRLLGPAPFDKLSRVELFVAWMLARGAARRQIAELLGCSRATVDAHCANVLAITALKNTALLARAAIRVGFVSAHENNDAEPEADEQPMWTGSPRHHCTTCGRAGHNTRSCPEASAEIEGRW